MDQICMRLGVLLEPAPLQNGLYEGMPLMAGSSSPDHNFFLLISFITKVYSVHLYYKPAGFPSKSHAKGVF